MRIYYEADGSILSAVWFKDLQFLDTIPFSFIEIDETASNIPKLKIIQSITQQPIEHDGKVVNGQVFYKGSVVMFNTDIDLSQLKTEYQNMIARLEQIQAAVNPTNAQIVQAIKDEALYIERIMKTIKKLII